MLETELIGRRLGAGRALPLPGRRHRQLGTFWLFSAFSVIGWVWVYI
jgi:hypothetical protein